MANKAKWTNEPTDSGYYWAVYKLTGGLTWQDGKVPELVYYSGATVTVIGRGDEYQTENFTDWYGPLEAPAMTKEQR